MFKIKKIPILKLFVRCSILAVVPYIITEVVVRKSVFSGEYLAAMLYGTGFGLVLIVIVSIRNKWIVFGSKTDPNVHDASE